MSDIWQPSSLLLQSAQSLSLCRKGSVRSSTALGRAGLSRWDLEENNNTSILPNQYALFSKMLLLTDSFFWQIQQYTLLLLTVYSQRFPHPNGKTRVFYFSFIPAVVNKLKVCQLKAKVINAPEWRLTAHDRSPSYRCFTFHQEISIIRRGNDPVLVHCLTFSSHTFFAKCLPWL